MGGLKNFLHVLYHYERQVNPVSMWVGKFLWVIGQVNLSILFFLFHISDTQVSRRNCVLAGHLIQFILKKHIGKGLFYFFLSNRIQSSSFVSKAHIDEPLLFLKWCFISIALLDFAVYLRNGKIFIFPMMDGWCLWVFIFFFFLCQSWSLISSWINNLNFASFVFVSLSCVNPSCVVCHPSVLLLCRCRVVSVFPPHFQLVWLDFFCSGSVTVFGT